MLKCYFFNSFSWNFYSSIFIKQLRYVLCSLCREPSFGHFNKDGILDVMVEEDGGDYQKRVGFRSYFLGPRSSYRRLNLDY